MSRRLSAAAVAAPLGVFLAVYLSNAGHGFLLDDFDWILDSRVRSGSDLARLFAATGGFYRPVVGLTFTVNEWLFGLHPFGYALTNIGLALACAWAIAFLARGFGLSRGAAAMAGVLWLMNMHFTRTSILWICGRTALAVTLAAVLGAAWLVRGRLAAATAALVVALFGKEEAVLLPFVLLAWLIIVRKATGRRPVTVAAWMLASGAALGVYFAARALTPAMTPLTAPGFYRFTFDPAAVLRNAAEYADRTSTVAVAATLVALAFLGRARAAVDARTRAAIGCGATWLLGMLGFAYVLPVRSDLYAAAPCVGACLMAAAVTDRLWLASTPARRQRALVAAIILPLLAAPVYWLRAQRMARLGDFSSAALDDLERLTRGLPPGAPVAIEDAVPPPGVRAPTMAAAFGAQLNAAYQLRAGRRLDLFLTPDRSSVAPDVAAAPPALRLAVEQGRLVVRPLGGRGSA